MTCWTRPDGWSSRALRGVCSRGEAGRASRDPDELLLSHDGATRPEHLPSPYGVQPHRLDVGATRGTTAGVREDAMTSAPATRAFYDADSHIMELPDFLKKY